MAPRSRAIRSRRAAAESESDIDQSSAPAQTQQSEPEDEDMEVQNEGNPEGEAEDDEDDEEPFDPSTFKDQPLVPQLVSGKLDLFIQDWSALDRKITESMKPLIRVAGSIEETRPEGDQRGFSIKLENGMRELLDAQRELEIHKAALEDLKKQVVSNRNIDNAEERYEKALKSELNKYRAQTSRQKYAKNRQYYKFKESVWEAKHEEAMPPVKRQIQAEEGDEDSDDDEVEVGGATQSYTCPISLKPFEDPVTSKICHHSYSRDPLKSYIKQNPNGAKCPAAGCKKSISLADCFNDTELAERQKIAVRRQKARQLQEEAEEENSDVVE